MCGLVGIIATGKLHLGETDAFSVFEQLLFIDTLRGPHSTGVFAVTNKHIHYLKLAMDGPSFLATKEYADWKKEVSKEHLRGLCGHNRYATVGDVNRKNAHPFMHGNVVGMHNGTLRAYDELPDSSKFEVDSEALVYAIDKIGLQESIEKIRGAYALSIYSSDDKTFTLCRNSERPLHIAKYQTSGGGGSLVYASEAGMIDMILDRKKRKPRRDGGTTPLEADTGIKIGLEGGVTDIQLPVSISSRWIYDYGSYRGSYKPGKSRAPLYPITSKQPSYQVDGEELSKDDKTFAVFTEFTHYPKSKNRGWLEGFIAVVPKKGGIEDWGQAGFGMMGVKWVPCRVHGVAAKGVESSISTIEGDDTKMYLVSVTGHQSGKVALVKIIGIPMFSSAPWVDENDILFDSSELDFFMVETRKTATLKAGDILPRSWIRPPNYECYRVGFNGKTFTKEEWDVEPMHICHNCGESIDFLDNDAIWSDNRSVVMCKQCSEQERNCG